MHSPIDNGKLIVCGQHTFRHSPIDNGKLIVCGQHTFMHSPIDNGKLIVCGQHTFMHSPNDNGKLIVRDHHTCMHSLIDNGEWRQNSFTDWQLFACCSDSSACTTPTSRKTSQKNNRLWLSTSSACSLTSTSANVWPWTSTWGPWRRETWVVTRF